jgi:hypothetical protein
MVAASLGNLRAITLTGVWVGRKINLVVHALSTPPVAARLRFKQLSTPTAT